jgi:hypothetical protein
MLLLVWTPLGVADAEEVILCDDVCHAGPPWSCEAELLVWWLRNGRIPPMLTTGPAASQGILDRPGVVVVYGNEKLDVNRHLGGRFTLTGWLDDDHSLGFQARGFVIERNSRTFKLSSDGSLLLARPYFDVATGTHASQVIAGPAPGVGDLSGSFYGFTKNELFGEQASLVLPIGNENLTLNLLAGGYFLQMRERLEFTSASKLLPDEAVIFGTTDKSKIYNRFYGGHLGVQGELWHDSWFLGFQGHCAFGLTTHRVNVFGDNVFATPFGRDWGPVGLLVQPSNSGKCDNSTLDVVYEFNVRAGCQLTSWLRVHVGYTLIYWTNPIRAGDQVDLSIDRNQGSGGAARPRVPFADDWLFATGGSVGIELSW